MPIREAEVQVLPGAKTRMWTYDGSFPGPTIRRPAGHRTEVTFDHRLPPGAGELSVHLHGGHNRTQFDGQPGGLTKSHPKSFFCDIPQGPAAEGVRATTFCSIREEQTYVYDLHEDGRPSVPRSSGTTITASTTRRGTSGTGSPGCGSSTTTSTARYRCPRASATSR